MNVWEKVLVTVLVKVPRLHLDPDLVILLCFTMFFLPFTWFREQDTRFQLEKREVSSVVTTMVSSMKSLVKLADPLPHMAYYLSLGEVLKYAVSFQLQIAKMDLNAASDVPFKNDPKHQMLNQLSGFYRSYKTELGKLKEYSEAHAGMSEEKDIMSICASCHSQLAECMLPQDLSDVIRRQSSEYVLTLQSMGPSFQKSAGNYFSGGANDWKSAENIPQGLDLKGLLTHASKTIGSVNGKTLKTNMTNFQKAAWWCC